MERRQIQLVHNPDAGQHNKPRVDALSAALRDAGFRVQESHSSPCHPFALLAGIDHVCVAGGDGTLRHVVAALVQHSNPPELSVYPMGTINLVAREWKVPSDPAAFAKVLTSGSGKQRFNAIRMNDTVFVACASIGPDARAVASVSEELKRRIGRLAYGVSLLWMLFRWQRPQLKILADDVPYEGEALYLANGRYFAGPWQLSPKARLDDPQLQLILLKRCRRRDFAEFMFATMVGKTDRLKNVQILPALKVELSCEVPQVIQLDGDAGGMTPASIEMLPSPFNYRP